MENTCPISQCVAKGDTHRRCSDLRHQSSCCWDCCEACKIECPEPKEAK